MPVKLDSFSTMEITALGLRQYGLSANMSFMRAIGLMIVLSLATIVPVYGQRVIPLWRSGTPERTHIQGNEHNVTKSGDRMIAGRKVIRYSDVSKPSMAVYPAPAGHNSGTAIVVFPGGAYRLLAYDAEGTEACRWLNYEGITCLLVKYRVPEVGRFPENVEDLEDAQQAIRITRSHAAEWHINPQQIGVLGFSAGGHLAIVTSNHASYSRSGIPANPLSNVSTQPNFVIAIYPAYLTSKPALDHLNPGIDPSATTPPTFLVQAEDDPLRVENVLVYFRALKNLNVPAELHIFSRGGHGFGLRPTDLPISHWTKLATNWMYSIHML